MWLLVVLITNTWNTKGGYALDSQQFHTQAQCEAAADAYKQVDAVWSRIKTVCRKLPNETGGQ